MKLLPSTAPYDSVGRAGTTPVRRSLSNGNTPASSKTLAQNFAPPAAENSGEKNVQVKGTKNKASVVKKRVRLRPETRDQLLERLRNPQLSLHEASILLRVSRATVRRYADSGRLPCLRTPGGQRRFTLRDIESFYRQLKMKR